MTCAGQLQRGGVEVEWGEGWGMDDGAGEDGESGGGCSGWIDVLGCDATAASEHVKRDALAEEDVPCLTADGCDVLDGRERRALVQVPFDAVRGVSARSAAQ